MDMIVYYIFEILIWAIIIDAVLTWIPSVDRSHPIVKLLHSITEPLLRPIR